MVYWGNSFRMESYHDLIKQVSKEEICHILKIMDNNKALGSDGFNTFFFKQVWCIINIDVCNVIKPFFSQAITYKGLNCTSVTLIPKIASLSSVSQFRPIVCCNTLYKLVSKILMLRLQKEIGLVIDQAQAGFIPNKQLIENVLLATE